MEFDFYEHHLELARRIQKHNRPVFWETERTVDFIYQYLLKVKSDDPELSIWRDRFDKNKHAGAKKYWDEILRGICSVLGDPDS